jgi:hypothetical protein
MTKKLLIGLSIVSLGLLSAYVYSPFHYFNDEPAAVAVGQQHDTATTSLELATSTLENRISTTSQNVGASLVATQQSKEGETIILKVGTETYTVAVPIQATIFDAMQILASTTSFRFEAKHYAGLGYFIESINGIRNEDGWYWTLYVDDAFAKKGASQYELKHGDRVEWKYEKH